MLALSSVAFSQEEEETFELSPFVVDGSEDQGYRAQNTLSGGRFNSNLGDSAASVSVWTAEFLEDFGVQDLNELTRYSLSTDVDAGDSEATVNVNQLVNAINTAQNIRIRGLQASRGRNFYQSITPDDGYRNGRYDESRGPNGILFGISNAGGMVSSSTTQASTSRDSTRFRYTGGDRENRSEIQLNRVLVEDKLGVAVAGLYEDSEGWRTWEEDERQRVYAAVAYRPTDRINIRVMGEAAEDREVRFRPFPVTDNVSRWIDSGRPLETPFGLAPDSAVLERNFNNFQQGNARNVGAEPRYRFIENIGELHNLSSTYIASGYDDLIDPLPGDDVIGQGGVGALRLNDPENFPYELAFNGPDVFRDSDFYWYQVEADFKLAENLYLNVGHNYQKITLDASYTAGNDPELQVDPNITLGVVQSDPTGWIGGGRRRGLLPPTDAEIAANLNPFAGQLYLEADHRYQERLAESEETRVALSYDWNSDSWMGRHRIAGALSRRTAIDVNESFQLAFLGQPFHPNPTNNDNLIWNRTYLTEGNFDSYAYRQSLIPFESDATRTVLLNDYSNPSAVGSGSASDGRELEVGWVGESGFGNSRTDQEIDAQVFVAQSYFMNSRLVTTVGLREDKATAFEYGLLPLADNGFILDQSGPLEDKTQKFVGKSKAFGAVFHLNDNISLIANYAASIGLPAFNRTVLPDRAREDATSTIPPPPDGEGTDFGISFSLMDDKIDGRIVYFTTDSVNETTGGTFGPIVRDNNEDIMDFLEGSLVGVGLPYTQEQWEIMYREMVTDADAAVQDSTSKGMELRLVANPTNNWRVSFNASYTDRTVSNFYKRGLPWLGYTLDDQDLLASFFSSRDKDDATDPEEFENTVYSFDNRGALDPEGTVYRLLALTDEANAIDGVDYFNLTSGPQNNRSIGEVLVDRQWFRLRDRFRDANRRWSLRPYRANVYSAYDFREGALKGFSVGGGLRWQSANIIGGDDSGVEWEGVEIFETDFMMRYRTNFKDTRVTYQVNIYNVFDDTSIIPQRLATSPDQMVPSEVRDLGVAYTRFDFQDPREVRFSVTLDF